jgi:chromosomal replication initiation ATPase DnaA
MIRRLHCTPPPRKPELSPKFVERVPLRRSITQAEREMIARIAAKIPDRVDHLARWDEGRDYAEQFVDRALHAAGVSRHDFFCPRRDNREAALASGIAATLRAKDANLYSLPKIGKYIGRRDHSTVIYAISRWSYFAAKYPDIADAIERAGGDA